MTKNRKLSGIVAATPSGPGPGEFSIGSLQSRAAARALLSTRIQSANRLDFVVSVIAGPDLCNPPRIGRWNEGPDGTMTRFSRIPWGMTLEQAERMVS